MALYAQDNINVHESDELLRWRLAKLVPSGHRYNIFYTIQCLSILLVVDIADIDTVMAVGQMSEAARQVPSTPCVQPVKQLPGRSWHR